MFADRDNRHDIVRCILPHEKNGGWSTALGNLYLIRIEQGANQIRLEVEHFRVLLKVMIALPPRDNDLICHAAPPVTERRRRYGPNSHDIGTVRISELFYDVLHPVVLFPA